MTVFSDSLISETLSSVRAKLISAAQGAGLTVTDWVVGALSQQMLESHAQAAFTFVGSVARIVRGFAGLDYATDPGDPDAYAPSNADLAPSAGFLSNMGLNTFFTERAGATFAGGFVTFTNAGIAARTFGPGALVFTWTVGPPSPAPTYRNAGDPSIYTNADGTVTVNAGSSLSIPVSAEEIGTRSNAPASSLSLTTSLVGCSATNPLAVLGTDREDAAVYRGRCRKAPARLSLAGPSAAYEYLSAKNLDGTPLYNGVDGSGHLDGTGDPVNIDRVQVTQDSATGIVNAYYASPEGAAIADDVTAANLNIEAEAFAVPDAITFTGIAATETLVPVIGTGKIAAGPGVSAALVKDAIVAAQEAYFASFPLGGLDQVAGAGVLYTEDLRGVARAAFPGLYAVDVSTPAGATTAIALGHVATTDTDAADWTITVV